MFWVLFSFFNIDLKKTCTEHTYLVELKKLQKMSVNPLKQQL